MALFDSSMFSQSGYNGILGELLSRLQFQQPQPSQGFPDGQGSYGGVSYPIYGQQEQAAIPQQAQPAQFQQQQQAPTWNERVKNFLQEAGRNLNPDLGQRGLTDDIKEFEYARSQGFQGTLTDWMLKKRAVSGEYGLQPIYGVGPDGKPAVIQLGKSGAAIQSKMPEGFQVARDPIKVDLGTHWGFLDAQSRQLVAQVPKELQKAAQQTAFGKEQGAAEGDLASLESKLPGLEKVVTGLDALSEKATYTLAGQALDFARRQSNLEPRAASVARAEYEAVVNNQVLPLLRDTFGAQFTEREGKRLADTLGDVTKAPKEKQAVLRAFIEQKRRDLDALQSRTGKRPTESAPAQSGVVDYRTYFGKK